VEPAAVARLLASCYRRTPVGRRDFALLTVLWRLGLRSAEAAALTVDDVCWRAGELVVAGKGGRCDRLPLPHDVGAAIADYCRHGRRRGGCDRRLFLRVHAPYTGLSRTAVGCVVACACDRAGLARVGAHALRHTAAREMRAAGAPLAEIGQLLRHQQAATTAHYARDDHEALTMVVRRWPGGAS
jgi:site-specific recombinase XerD